MAGLLFATVSAGEATRAAGAVPGRDVASAAAARRHGTPDTAADTRRHRTRDIGPHRATAPDAGAGGSRERRSGRLLAGTEVAAARRLRRTEGREAADTDRIETLAARDRALDALIAADEARLARLVPLLTTLRTAPLGGVLLAPGSTADAPRALEALRGLATGIARVTARLRAEREQQRGNDVALAGAKQRLAALHERTTPEQDRVEGDLRRLTASELAGRSGAEAAAAVSAERAARQSRDLRDAIAALAAAAPPSSTPTARPVGPVAGGSSGRHAGARAGWSPAVPAGRDRSRTGVVARSGGGAVAAASRRDERVGGSSSTPVGVGGASSTRIGGTGRLAPPVAGPVAVRFGAATASGPASGISFAPPPSALVSAPCAGVVEFASDFRDYGRTAIIRCGGGNAGGGERVVLAGLAQLDTAAGTRLRAGQPIGRMPDWVPGRAGGRPTLLLQLRRGTTPVDPAPLLR